MGKVMLNIGGGSTILPCVIGSEWKIIDGSQEKDNDVFLEDYIQNSVDEIYSSHLIAYFNYDAALQLLSQWFSALKPGGILSVSTPDWDKLRTIEQPLVGPIYGKMLLNGEQVYHKMIYNYHTLYSLLRSAGFINIVRWECASGMNDCSAATYDGKEISLNIQATKP